MKLATGLYRVEDDVVSIISLKIVYFCAERLCGSVLFVLVTLEVVYSSWNVCIGMMLQKWRVVLLV